MTLKKIEKNNTICAVVCSTEIVIADAQSALDVLMTAKYEIGTKNIVISKQHIDIKQKNFQCFFANSQCSKMTGSIYMNCSR